ncbi:MAG: glycosyltransferase family 39 protein [Acidobacteria bacterium]|nr:glycosyltransferase family 39 protein [Acidobacteriota bacterium]
MARERLFITASKSALRLERADWLAIAIIAAVASLPRLLIALSLPPLVHLDSDSYFEIAQRLWQGEGFGDLSRRTPLYPLFLWLTARFPQAGLFPVVLAQHLMGVATAVLFFLIARRLFSTQLRWAAAICGLTSGVVIYPVLLEQTVLSEPLYIFLVSAAAYCLLAWVQEGRDSMAVACGALLALAALTRPIGAGVFALWLAVIFLFPGRKPALRFLLFGGSAFAALLLPLLLRNYMAMGSFALQQSLGRNLISVTDRFVDYEAGAHLPIKAVYREYLRDKRGPDAVVVYAAMPRLRQTTGWSDPQIDRALTEIAWEAIRAHPLEYFWSRLRRLPLLFRDPGLSQRYVLEAETYLPFLQFAGQINPELISRSLAFPGRTRARFEWAELIYRIFAFNLTSGWLFLLPLAGMIAMIWRERSPTAWAGASLLVYHHFATILVQPPNARYRLPTIPWEILFAVAGVYFAARALTHWAERLWKEADRGERARWGYPDEGIRRGITGPLLATGVVLAVVGGRALLEIPARLVLQAADFRQAATPAEGTNRIVRELAVAGRTFPVFYRDGQSQDHDGSAWAESIIQGGLSYELNAAYSCETSECGGGILRITSFDSSGEPLGSESLSLSRERIDNDLFWDQITQRIAVPRSARRLRVELQFRAGMGNAVVPSLKMRVAPTLFTVWQRQGFMGK